MNEALFSVYLIQLGAAVWIHFRSKKSNRRIPLAAMALLVLLPIAGGVFFLGSWFYKATYVNELEDVFDHGSHDMETDLKYEKKIEFEKETNFVPVEEALILNDNNIKRQLIMDTVKEDAYHYIGFLKMAMADKDMETSHYAASIIMETNRRLQNVIQEMTVAYEANPVDLETLNQYSELVGKYYHSGLLDQASQLRYGYLYSRLLKEQIALGQYSEVIYSEKITTDIALGNIPEVMPTIDQYKDHYPESEKPYLLWMRHYYQAKNAPMLQMVIRELEGRHVNFSREGQELIRFWTEEEI